MNSFHISVIVGILPFAVVVIACKNRIYFPRSQQDFHRIKSKSDQNKQSSKNEMEKTFTFFPRQFEVIFPSARTRERERERERERKRKRAIWANNINTAPRSKPTRCIIKKATEK